ncbi:NDP-sugar synthase [bacterium]|nr:NDP-sugar synthase [bacterium]MCI0601397.1 NDP-sugar synthase [bacterium]
MKALILAAGLGTRVRPFTFFRAKATLPLLNIPFIHYPLHYCSVHGIQEAVVNLHSLPDSVREAAGNKYGNIRISYSEEPEILGTAGAMRKAARLLDGDPFLVMNSDMLTDIPLQEVLSFHQDSQADITLVIMKDARFSHYGGLYFQGDLLRLSGFRSGPGESYHYTGLQVVSPQILEHIPDGKKTGIFTDIYPGIMKDKKIYGFVYHGFWKEMGNLREYLRTSLELVRQPLPEKLIPEGAQLSMVSPEATIEEGADVIDSLVMDGARIESGVRVEHSIIGWDVTVTGTVRNQALARGILPWYL